MAYVRKKEPKTDEALAAKTADPTAGTIRRRKAQIPGNRGSYFWKILCTSCEERLEKRLMVLAVS